MWSSPLILQALEAREGNQPVSQVTSVIKDLSGQFPLSISSA